MIVAAIAAAILLSATPWGPGTHVYLSSVVLKRMKRRLAPEYVELLENHRDNFVYGNIAADIINFKKYGGLKNHCHNWNIKERIEALTSDESERAFLLGYLCHLAADIVAHNHFVPFQIVYGMPPKVLGHTYWEARADSTVTEEYWHLIDGLRNRKPLRANDKIINQAVPKKALSLSSNKWIFNNIVLARSKRSWRAVMEQMRSRKPRGEIHQRFLTECHSACLDNMFKVFDPERLELLREIDPNGRETLREARALRRNLLEKYGTRNAAADEAKSIAKRKFRIRAHQSGDNRHLAVES